MQSFGYKRAADPTEALLLAKPRTRFLAGGTTLVDLMKLEVEVPTGVIDLRLLPFGEIRRTPEGGLHVGALVKNAELAQDERVRKHYAVLSEAILAGASAQIRNKATTSGNLLQRTRCMYFRDVSKPCNKREPGSGCAAIGGANRNLAILGTSDACIATNPSDMNVALAALEAKIHLQSPSAERAVAIADFHLLPGDSPEKETVMTASELITGVSLAALPPGTRTVYVKLRDRASYEFALASAAVVVTMHGGLFSRVRIAMGGIGTKPWRSRDAESLLEGKPANDAHFSAAADVFLRGARPQSENGFKVELAKRCLTYALKKALTA